MSQPSPESNSSDRSPWPILGAAAFLVASLLVAGVVIGLIDPVALFPAPSATPVPPTRIPPTPVLTATPTPVPPLSQRRALIALLPPDNDGSGLADELPDAIRGALEGSRLAGLVEVVSGGTNPDDALEIAWALGDDGLIQMTIHSRFEPSPAALEDSLIPYNIVGPETTPLIIDPADGPALPGGLASALLELELGPEPGTLDRIRLVQGLPSSLTQQDQAHNQALLLFAVAQGQAALGDPTAALETYSQVLRQEPDFPAAVLNRASVYLALGDRGTALAVYDGFKDVDSYQGVMSYNRAIATLSGDNPEAALQSAEALVMEDPSAAWRVNLRGYIRFKHGDHQAALDDFTRANDIAPGTPILLLNRAETLMVLHRYDEALQVFDALTILEPKNALFRYRQALGFEAAGNTPSAFDALSQAIVLDDRHADAYLERARLEVEAGDFENARVDADHVLALDPENGPAYQITGDCLLAQEEWVEAEKAYSTAEDLGVSSIALYSGRGWAHHRQEELRSAIADYREAISLGADDTTLLFRLGFALIDMNQRKDALNALSGAVNGGMDTAEAHAALALALDMNNRSDEAELEYKHALSLDERYEDRDFLRDQPLWSPLSIDRAMAILRRLKG